MRSASALWLAACILVSFILGLSVRGIVGPADQGAAIVVGGASVPGEALQEMPHPEAVAHEAPAGTLLAAVSLQPEFGSGPMATIYIPVMPGDHNAAAAMPLIEQIPEYVRRQWERTGYRLDSQRHYLLARLPDGEQIAVPVDQLLVKQLDSQVY